MKLIDKQKHLLFACIITAIVSGGLVYFLLSPPSTAQMVEPVVNDAIKTPGTTVQSNELWMQQMSQEAQMQNKKLAVLEQMAHKQATKETTEDATINQLKQELDELKQKFMLGHNTPTSEPGIQSTGTGANQRYAPLVKHTLNLQGASYKLGLRIPPGSYVKAVLLSAVDVGVGVNVSADPQPVVMRLLGDGHLPNNACTTMKRCHMVGAAVGDLSSERAFIRLEKMSCVDTRTHSIIETDVSGYVTGEDGKNGLAGVVVDRSGRMLRGAVLAGLLSGVSAVAQNLATAKHGDAFLSKLGDRGVQNNVLASDFMRGSTQGVTNAFDKLADYYIKRAEQLQPVVQINPGRIVHIVFSKGSNYGRQSPLQPKNQEAV